MQEFIEQAQRLERAIESALASTGGDEEMAIELCMINATGTLSMWSYENWRKVFRRHANNKARREEESETTAVAFE